MRWMPRTSRSWVGCGLWLAHLYHTLHSPHTWVQLEASSSRVSVIPGYHLNSTLPGVRGLNLACPKSTYWVADLLVPAGVSVVMRRRFSADLIKLGWGVRIEPQSSMNGANVRLILMQTQGREISYEDAETPTRAESCEVETGLALCCRKASA